MQLGLEYGYGPQAKSSGKDPSAVTGQGDGWGLGLTAKITAEHQIEHEKAVFIVLEGISQVDDERVVNLIGRKANKFQQRDSV